MNPVGYFLYDQQAEEWEETYAGTPNSVPLYKHPAELSGVEIIGMSGNYDFNYEVDIIDFARAILRKAQSD